MAEPNISYTRGHSSVAVKSSRDRVSLGMESLLVVGSPRRESSMERLSQALERLLGDREVVYLPMPEDLCREVVDMVLERGLYDIERVSRHVGVSIERLWRPVLTELIKILGRPEYWYRELRCLFRGDYRRVLEERGVRIAYLLYKANVFGKIDLREWEEVFRDRRPSSLREVLGGSRGERALYLTDSYRDVLEASLYIPYTETCFIDEMAPTPLEVVDIIVNMRRDLLPILREAVDWSIEYLNNLVRLSSLDETYTSVLEKRGYREFLERIGLEVFKRECMASDTTDAIS